MQPCVRTVDIDVIGTTSRHVTFFEMMGNFSFGDYFKELAIEYAWELLTDGYGLDPVDLWVTVHISDDEAEAIWHEVPGLLEGRLQRLDEDNFWKMGKRGPAGQARRSSSTGGRSTDPPVDRLKAGSAMSSSGTSCSCSTTAMRTVRSPSSPSATSTREPGSTGS